MKFLKNEKAWKRFVNGNSSQEWKLPESYPCYVYLTVKHWGYEEDQTNFLYPDDVFKMAMHLRSEIQQ